MLSVFEVFSESIEGEKSVHEMIQNLNVNILFKSQVIE